jgi:hypothetical protein
MINIYKMGKKYSIFTKVVVGSLLLLLINYLVAGLLYKIRAGRTLTEFLDLVFYLKVSSSIICGSSILLILYHLIKWKNNR